MNDSLIMKVLYIEVTIKILNYLLGFKLTLFVMFVILKTNLSPLLNYCCLLSGVINMYSSPFIIVHIRFFYKLTIPLHYPSTALIVIPLGAITFTYSLGYTVHANSKPIVYVPS
jgi:hypothetical protein